MIEFLLEKMSDARFLATLFAAVGAAATVLTLAMPLLARDDLHRRLKAVAIEREKLRQRERERLARGEMAGSAGGAGKADPGRLPRPGGLYHLSVLPDGGAGRDPDLLAVLPVRGGRCRAAGPDQDRGLPDRRLFRRARSFALPAEQDHPAAALDQARVSRRAGSAADLRGIRHVGRSRVPQGRPGDRHAVDSAGRGIHADDRRAFLSAGPPAGL